MIISVYIKNFKAYERETITLNKNNVLIGENDAGKSSVLQALDYFFNYEKIEPKYVRNENQPVEIGILTEDKVFIKKKYTGRSFKMTECTRDLNSISNLKYIYISPSTLDIKKLISDLAIAKSLSLLPNDIKTSINQICAEGLNEVISSIDPSLLVVGGNTDINGTHNLKIESAIKYDITSSGVPLEGRGSGYQKNLTYSLLSGNQYDNVIIGIDEIENSLSLKNSKDLLRVLKEKFSQTLITTHSTQVVKSVNDYEILPIYSEDGINTITELYETLNGGSDESIFVLVEGKTDVPWIRKILGIINDGNSYIVLPCGGHTNIESVKQALSVKGYVCKIIKDGDSGDNQHSIRKECIELYITLDAYNSIFDKTEVTLPQTKRDFFDSLIDEFHSEDSIKSLISKNVDTFLDDQNDLVSEIRALLNNN